jgi:uncharacterized MAPEG superfamily protein
MNEALNVRQADARVLIILHYLDDTPSCRSFHFFHGMTEGQIVWAAV